MVNQYTGQVRTPGTYGCGCRIGTGDDCPKMSCPGKYALSRSKHSLDSELYDPKAPL